MTAFLEMFEPIQKGDFGLTEEVIYKSIHNEGDFVPIWGGNKEHDTINRLVYKKALTKSEKPITIFDGKGIVISLDGSAGRMTLKNKQEFALNHHAGFFKLKQHPEQEVLLEFFAVFYEKQLIEASVSEGSKTLTLSQVYSMDFDIPPINIQSSLMSKLKPILNKRRLITAHLMHIRSLKDRGLSHTYFEYQGQDIPVGDVLDHMGGNSGLTEEEIYKKSLLGGTKYIVLSGATLEEMTLGEISKCNIKSKPIKVFENKEGLLVVRKGKAGSMVHLPKGRYTINDDAYILFIRERVSYHLSLKWFMRQYRKSVLDYSSSSDNGTWNMTGFFGNVTIDIPEYEEQLDIVRKYEELEMIENRLHSINDHIDKLLEKSIIY